MLARRSLSLHVGHNRSHHTCHQISHLKLTEFSLNVNGPKDLPYGYSGKERRMDLGNETELYIEACAFLAALTSKST